MSPSNPLVASQLHQLIFYHLDNDFLQNALFFAGRLHGLEPRSPDTAHLLALCHLKLGHFKAAYDYSRDSRLRGNHLGCAFVFAQACLALERYQDGTVALEKCRGLWAVRNHWSKLRLLDDWRPGTWTNRENPRSTFGELKKTSAGRGSSALLARKALSSKWRNQKSSRLLR